MLKIANTYQSKYKTIVIDEFGYLHDFRRENVIYVNKNLESKLNISGKIRVVFIQLLVHNKIRFNQTVMVVWNGVEGYGVDIINVSDFLGIHMKYITELPPNYIETISAVIECAIILSKKGLGGLFVIGNEMDIYNYSAPIDYDPFSCKNKECALSVFSEKAKDIISKFARLDYAFFIDSTGLVRSLLNRISVSHQAIGTTETFGLGSRHLTAKSLTKATELITITVQESEGTIRVFHQGHETLRIEVLRH